MTSGLLNTSVATQTPTLYPIKFQNNNETYEMLLKRYIKIIGKFVEFYACRKVITPDEGEQLGRIALFESLKSYETGHNTKFSTFLYHSLIHQFSQHVYDHTKRKRVKGASLQDIIGCHDKSYLEMEMRDVLEQLSCQKDYEIFMRHYFHKETFRSIGRSIGKSHERVNQLVKSFINKNESHIRSLGV